MDHEIDPEGLQYLTDAANAGGILQVDPADHSGWVQYLASWGYLRYRHACDLWTLTDAGWATTEGG